MGYQKMSGSSPKNENQLSSLKAQKRKDEVTFFEESKVDQDKKRKKAKELADDEPVYKMESL